MAEPGTTGEAIQVVRRVLYDLTRQPAWNRAGATQAEILNYAMKRGWKVPVTDFERERSAVPWTSSAWPPRCVGRPADRALPDYFSVKRPCRARQLFKAAAVPTDACPGLHRPRVVLFRLS